MGAKLAGRTKGRRRAVMAEINVTPFVDVMLVLLVIFMVTAPLLTAGVEIKLPKANATALSQQDNKPLEIALDSKGVIFLGETRLRLDELDAKLRAIAGETAADRRIYLKADEKLDWGKVAEVMATIRTSGFTNIGLVMDSTGTNKGIR
jgi:biopolymer transport protein TolR